MKKIKKTNKPKKPTDFRPQPILTPNYKNIGSTVRFWLTNSWHFGKIDTVGWKWVTISYPHCGVWKKHKIKIENINTELAEV